MTFNPKYSNPDVPHEVNVSEKTPVRDFLRLAIGVCLIVVVISTVVFFTARLWAPLIPFRYEDRYGEKMGGFNPDSDAPSRCEAEGAKALQALADGLAAEMALPEGMKVRVHFDSSETPNAFATLGGNIVIFRGLLDHTHSENALAMTLAHEIGHIKYRDPIVSLGGGVAVALVFSAALDGSDGGALASWAIGMTQMSFSREQEARADREAIAALRRYYGYTNGADEFFDYIVREHPTMSQLPAFVSTHPTPPSRLKTIRESFADEPQTLKPLPDAIQRLRQCK
ncbi:MAG: M48 family metallopeptidase [Acidobacteriota bacterium]|jgi:Zn-dependent protease with chaperone function|nr:M48 family metallopeptidase [Acidobacteriota bacterium]